MHAEFVGEEGKSKEGPMGLPVSGIPSWLCLQWPQIKFLSVLLLCRSAQAHFRNPEAENKAGKFVFPEQMGRFGVLVEAALTAGSV